MVNQGERRVSLRQRVVIHSGMIAHQAPRDQAEQFIPELLGLNDKDRLPKTHRKQDAAAYGVII